MHTTVSDGTDTPEELLLQVKKAGIELFAVTDHDAVKAGSVIKKLAAETPGAPLFIPGVEFSCRDEAGKYHILGYGFNPDGPEIAVTVEAGHRLRMEKVYARIEFLRTEFGFEFPEEEIEKLLTLDNPGKPHIGNLMVKYGYAESRGDAIDRFLNRQSFRENYLRPEQAIRGILDAGGIPVLAHPFYGSGDELILGEEMEERLTRLKGYGLCGIEAYYSGFSPKLIRAALELSKRYSLLVTAGSDYHGANKQIELGNTGLDRSSEPPRELLETVERLSRAI